MLPCPLWLHGRLVLSLPCLILDYSNRQGAGGRSCVAWSCVKVCHISFSLEAWACERERDQHSSHSPIGSPAPLPPLPLGPILLAIVLCSHPQHCQKPTVSPDVPAYTYMPVTRLSSGCQQSAVSTEAHLCPWKNHQRVINFRGQTHVSHRFLQVRVATAGEHSL